MAGFLAFLHSSSGSLEEAAELTGGTDRYAWRGGLKCNLTVVTTRFATASEKEGPATEGRAQPGSREDHRHGEGERGHRQHARPVSRRTLREDGEPRESSPQREREDAASTPSRPADARCERGEAAGESGGVGTRSTLPPAKYLSVTLLSLEKTLQCFRTRKAIYRFTDLDGAFSECSETFVDC